MSLRMRGCVFLLLRPLFRSGRVPDNMYLTGEHTHTFKLLCPRLVPPGSFYSDADVCVLGRESGDKA